MLPFYDRLVDGLTYLPSLQPGALLRARRTSLSIGAFPPGNERPRIILSSMGLQALSDI